MANGGNDETERAVGRGLIWLAKQQHKDGYWEFDGSHKDSRVAATGLCLLPFFGAGENHVNAKRYKNELVKGVAYLKSQIKDDGSFEKAGMYEQAIGTIALCEAYGMTGDEQLQKTATQAVDFIVKAQGGNGSWGYAAGNAGDTSILGWQMQALSKRQMGRDRRAGKDVDAG